MPYSECCVKPFNRACPEEIRDFEEACEMEKDKEDLDDTEEE